MTSSIHEILIFHRSRASFENLSSPAPQKAPTGATLGENYSETFIVVLQIVRQNLRKILTKPHFLSSHLTLKMIDNKFTHKSGV